MGGSVKHKSSLGFTVITDVSIARTLMLKVRIMLVIFLKVKRVFLYS